MAGFVIFGALFLVVGLVLVIAPNKVNKLDNAKIRAVRGPEAPQLKNRPTAQRIAGAIPVLGGIAIIIYGIAAH